MIKLLILAYAFVNKVLNRLEKIGDQLYLCYILKENNIDSNLITSNGRPYIKICNNGHFMIGKNFKMNNGLKYNIIGFPQPCCIYVGEYANLKIGDNVGMSQTSLICHYSIEIGNDVKFGGGVKVYDTDFHSINPSDRLSFSLDMKNKRKEKVTIKDNVLIGAGSIVLKGVTIGTNSIVGAGSVVTKSIPENEIWAGNPARFIKKIVV